MAKIVRDWCGEPLELRVRVREDPTSRSPRPVELAQTAENLWAMVLALCELGRLDLAFADTLTFEEIRPRIEEALVEGSLQLRPVERPLPGGNIIDVDPPEPLVPDDDDDDVVKPTHTLELTLHDPEGKPVANAAFKVKLPDGEIRKGNLNAQGKVALAGIKKPGNCEVTFTDFDQDAWVPA